MSIVSSVSSCSLAGNINRNVIAALVGVYSTRKSKVACVLRFILPQVRERRAAHVHDLCATGQSHTEAEVYAPPISS